MRKALCVGIDSYEYAGDRVGVRPDRGRSRLYHEHLLRLAGGAHRDGGQCLCPRGVQDHRPRDGSGLPRRGQRRVRGPRLQHHEGLLQDAQGDRRRHR